MRNQIINLTKAWPASDKGLFHTWLIMVIPSSKVIASLPSYRLLPLMTNPKSLHHLMVALSLHPIHFGRYKNLYTAYAVRLATCMT